MTTYYLNGNPILEGSSFTIGGITYPYEWLEGTNQSVRSSLGIEKTNDITYDQTYYYAPGLERNLEDTENFDKDGNLMYVQVLDEETRQMVNTSEKLISRGLKYTMTRKIKLKCNELLSPTDFYVIRNAVEGFEIPADVAEYRSAVIAEQDRVTTAIAAVTSVPELIEVMTSVQWPVAL